MNDHEAVCETGAFRIIGRPTRTAGPSTTTVLARIMTALDHATADQYDDVMALIRGGELYADTVLEVCVILDLPAGVVLCAVRDDTSGLDDVLGLHADS